MSDGFLNGDLRNAMRMAAMKERPKEGEKKKIDDKEYRKKMLTEAQREIAKALHGLEAGDEYGIIPPLAGGDYLTKNFYDINVAASMSAASRYVKNALRGHDAE